MEKYSISIGNGFAIENQGSVPVNHKVEHFKIDELAELEIINDKVQWIQNPFNIDSDLIEKCKEHDFMNINAEFKVFNIKGQEWEEKETFNGTLINALEYIQENFKDE